MFLTFEVLIWRSGEWDSDTAEPNTSVLAKKSRPVLRLLHDNFYFCGRAANLRLRF
jgi:hypothetical protein